MDETRAPEADADAPPAGEEGGPAAEGSGGPEEGAGPELPDPADLLAGAAERLGHPGVPELVQEVGAVARRGNPVAALAGGGSGKELLYALAAAERCDPSSPALQALVLSPTPEEADRAARALHLLGGPTGLAALAWLPWREPPEGEDHPFAQLMAGRPAELMPRVEAGRLKLGDLKLLVLDGVSALEETGQWEAVEAILDTLPGDAQKLVTDTRGSERFRDLITHQLGRARKWPPELFAPGDAGEPDEGAPALLAAAGGSEEERLDRLADALRQAAGEADADRAVIRCRDGEEAHRVATALAARGVELTDEAEGPGVAVAWGEDEPRPEGIGVLFGLPLSLESLRWLDDAAVRAAVVDAGHRDQLRLLARRRGWRLRAVPEGPAPAAGDRIQRWRRRIRERIEGRDDAAEALVLEPLVREHGAARVAEALAGLLREGAPAPPEAAEAEADRSGRPERPPRGAAPRGRGGASGGGSRSGGSGSGGGDASRQGTWTRIFVSAGERDDVGPGDLVGAITGETRVTGDQIGRIDIRESYSLVDVEPDVAEEVMAGLTGISIRGREVVARPDRKS